MNYYKVWFKQHGYSAIIRDMVLPAKSERMVKFVVKAAYPGAYAIKVAHVAGIR